MPATPRFKPSQALTLPPWAPRLRMTSGLGTAAQKTWNLRRLVTIIGSGRQSTIVLNSASVSKSHCAIVNTGNIVLLKDLGSDAGTLHNDERIDLTLLNDGDVIQAADVHIQVALQFKATENNQTESGLCFEDPMRVIQPITLRIVDTDTCWTLDSPVCVAGRREGSPVFLDDVSVSLAHALFFYVEGMPVVCDLGSRSGTWINGTRQTIAPLRSGDRVRFGPFETEVTRTADAQADNPPIARPWPSLEDLERWETELNERAAQLVEREEALQGSEDRLRAREEELCARESTVEPALSAERGALPPGPAQIAFTGLVQAADPAAAIDLQAHGAAKAARVALDRVWQILQTDSPRVHDCGAAGPPVA